MLPVKPSYKTLGEAAWDLALDLSNVACKI